MIAGGAPSGQPAGPTTTGNRTADRSSTAQPPAHPDAVTPPGTDKQGPSPPPPPPPGAHRHQAQQSASAPVSQGSSPPQVASPPGTPSGGQSAAVQPPAPPHRQQPGSAAKTGTTPAQAPPTARRVARLITTDKSSTQLKPAADGKLPELRLADSPRSDSEPETQQGVHPLALLALLCASFVASLAMLFVEPGKNTSKAELKRRARQEIEADYFANLGQPGPQEPYQFLLREAHQAYARGDYQRQRRLYRQVLQLLRSERGRFESITGSRNRDKRLEELLIILLDEQ